MRYTIEDLQTMTDKELVLSVLNERRTKCTNVYAPLSQRLQRTLYRLGREDFGDRKGYLIDVSPDQ